MQCSMPNTSTNTRKGWNALAERSKQLVQKGKAGYIRESKTPPGGAGGRKGGHSMRYETLHRYIVDSHRYGWKPSLEGMRAYAEQERSGIRARWAPHSSGESPSRERA